ncbi:MAG TPA: DUF6165 family protein [Rhizomicrobium sp.]|nr:DUF6165 family protein [Rhizomicrobium sp.]
MRAVTVPVSFGEAADKITILTIKSEWMRDAAQVENVRKELAVLTAAFFATVARTPEFDALFDRLTQVNRKLWTIEDAIRLCEKDGNFGKEFVTLARSVYQQNDERARIKREINKLLGSELIEEKSYQGSNG